VDGLQLALGHRVGTVIDIDLVFLETLVQQPGCAAVVDDLLDRHGFFPLEYQLALVLALLSIDRPRL